MRLPAVSDPDPIRQPAGAKVDPDGAHAEVARYLTDPVALQAACEGDGFGSICDREQLHRLLLFRGFITKIKHNALRRAIPCTLRLISTLKFEIESMTSIIFPARSTFQRYLPTAERPCESENCVSRVESNLDETELGRPERSIA